MKNKKVKIIVIYILIILTITSLSITMVILVNKEKLNTTETTYYNGLPIYYNHASYAYDTSTPEKAIGASDYTFVAKVNGIIRTEYRNPVEMEVNKDGTKTQIVSDPYTIYDVTVIKNIKGNLITTQNIEVEQIGGITQDGKSYVFLEDTKLLTIGDYYILLAFVPFEKGTLQINNPDTILSLGTITELDTTKAIDTIISANSSSEIKSKTDSVIENVKVNSKIIKKVSTYKNAYLKQIIPDGISTESKKTVYNKSIYDISYNQ